MLSTTKLLFTFLISTLIAISTATVPCCDFDPTCAGDWTSPTWQPSTIAVPNTAGYPGFLSTRPNIYYEWLQDRSGALSSVVSFPITTTGAVISMDFYYYRADPLASDDYFHVTFKTPTAISGRVLASVTTTADYWRHLEIVCDASLDYCCGPLETVPCTGTFEIIGSLNVAVSTGLFGVTNFGECNYVPTTIPPYTLPPPVPSGCCDFESNVCGLTASGWYWTVTRPDPYPVPYYSGNYLWTDIYGAQAYSYEQLTIQPSTTFSLAFYVASSSGAIDVTFQDYAGPTTPLGSLPYTSGFWQHRTYSGYSLCTVFPCNGRFIFTARPGASVVALDDVERDGTCHGSFPCCYFDDPYFCDFNNPGYLGNAWKWSGNSLPVYPPPYPSPHSEYVYFETVGYVGVDFKAPLYSDLIDISSASSFVGNFYAKTPFGPSGLEALELTFTETNTGTATYMEYVKETYGNWMQIQFLCRGPHGDCCQGLGPYCRGSLAFVAHVQDNGGTVLFGIDATSDGSCVPFPGLTMKSGSGNSTMIRLHA